MQLSNIPFYAQEEDHWCGPATLQMVFAHLGKNISQTELATKARTTVEFGTDNLEMQRVAQEEGFAVTVKTESTTQDIRTYLEKGIPVIVNFIKPKEEEGHYAVVVGLEDEAFITFHDPWSGENTSMSHADFLKRWVSEDAQHKQWLMVIKLA